MSMQTLSQALTAFSSALDHPMADWFTLVILKFLVAWMLLLAAKSNQRTPWLSLTLTVIGLALMGDMLNSSIKKAPPMTPISLTQYGALLVLAFQLAVHPLAHRTRPTAGHPHAQ